MLPGATGRTTVTDFDGLPRLRMLPVGGFAPGIG
jgi:hypothetical protein